MSFKSHRSACSAVCTVAHQRAFNTIAESGPCVLYYVYGARNIFYIVRPKS